MIEFANQAVRCSYQIGTMTSSSKDMNHAFIVALLRLQYNETVDGVFKHTRAALALIPSDQYHKRGLVAMSLAIAHWGMGELAEAETVIVKSLDAVSSAGNLLACNSICMVLGELYIQQGYLDKASALVNQTITRLVKENQAPILMASLYLTLAKTAFLSGENQRAYALLEESKAHGQKYSLIDWKYKYYLMLSRIYCSEGFFGLARDCLRECKSNYFLNPMPDDISFEEMEAIIAYKANRIANIAAPVIMIAYQLVSFLFGSETTLHYVFFSVVEVLGNGLILVLALRWKQSLPEVGHAV
jgi:ATP/maltotriose-dependent transcriptional regulator MalT